MIKDQAGPLFDPDPKLPVEPRNLVSSGPNRVPLGKSNLYWSGRIARGRELPNRIDFDDRVSKRRSRAVDHLDHAAAGEVDEGGEAGQLAIAWGGEEGDRGNVPAAVHPEREEAVGRERERRHLVGLELAAGDRRPPARVLAEERIGQPGIVLHQPGLPLPDRGPSFHSARGEIDDDLRGSGGLPVEDGGPSGTPDRGSRAPGEDLLFCRLVDA